MIPEILWIIGFYAAAVAIVHWMIRRGSGEDRRHYVLVAGNHQMQIEWYIRALQQFSRRTGTEIGITVVLDQSTDDTRKILERFARSDTGIEWVRKSTANSTEDAVNYERLGSGNNGDQEGKQKVVFVELARSEEVARLPL